MKFHIKIKLFKPLNPCFDGLRVAIFEDFLLFQRFLPHRLWCET